MNTNMDLKDYLNIMSKATNNLKELVINDKSNIQVMYGCDCGGKYFVQYLIDEYKDNDMDLSIVENMDSEREAISLARTLSNLYGLDLIEF